METPASPDTVEALKAALAAALVRADEATVRADEAEAKARMAATELATAVAEATSAKAEAASVKAEVSNSRALIAALQLKIEKLQRELRGQRSESKKRLLDQLEMELEDLEATATEDDLAAEKAAAVAGTEVKAHVRKSRGRKPFPAHLPRERVVLPAPETCPCCGSDKLSKIGEHVTETLEEVPRSFKVVQTVREKFSCRSCETITQPPAPFHPTPRGWAGPNLLAGILVEKFAAHQPLNRQAERFGQEGLDISLSTLADQVGAATFTLMPLVELIARHVLAAERLHADDTTVPVLAKSKTITGRLWVNVRDDRPFGGGDAPAALFAYSRDRRNVHPQEHLEGYTGILQADAYSGYNPLFKQDRKPAPLISALCWAHARRKFFELADIDAVRRKKNKPEMSPLALDAVRRIDALFDVEREINGLPPDQRLAVRQERCRPLVGDLENWMRTARQGLSRHADVAKAMDYMLTRWAGFTRFLEDGRICLTNNSAERALRGVALGRRAWLFCGSDRGGHRAAAMYTLIVTAKLNDVDPRAWLADVLARINDHPVQRLHELLPWNWKAAKAADAEAA